MRGDDEPAVGKAHPGLHLAADLAGRGVAVEQRRGHREVAAVGRDHGARQRARQADRRARGAEGLDFRVAVEILAAAVADGARIVAKDRVERGDVVGHQRLLVALERRLDFGDDLRPVDLHSFLPDRQFFGLGAAATPACSSACAMRSATSSRHGAAMICTPIGSGSSGTGTATTGRPMNEIGWV